MKRKKKGKRKQCQQNLRENTLSLSMKVCSHRIVQISSQMREIRTFLTEVTYAAERKRYGELLFSRVKTTSVKQTKAQKFTKATRQRSDMCALVTSASFPLPDPPVFLTAYRIDRRL